MKCIGNGESRDIVVLLKDRIDSLTKTIQPECRLH